MAGISLRSNIAALVAQRRLGEASDASARSFERLSSGFRINKASDDAAGIAIASSLNASRRVFTRGIQNLNDGLSLTNVADGAISQLSSVVIRIRELATQSANGTLSFRQRRSLDTEAQALKDEFFRIARATEFNGLKLFDSTIQELRVQGGYGVDGSVASNLGGALGNGTFGSLDSYVQESLRSNAVTFGDLNGDGVLDMVSTGEVDGLTEGRATVRLGNVYGPAVEVNREIGCTKQKRDRLQTCIRLQSGMLQSSFRAMVRFTKLARLIGDPVFKTTFPKQFSGKLDLILSFSPPPIPLNAFPLLV